MIHTRNIIAKLVNTFQPGDAHAIKKRETKTKENETEYDYDSLLDEYYEQEKNESRSKDTYQIKKTGIVE